MGPNDEERGETPLDVPSTDEQAEPPTTRTPELLADATSDDAEVTVAITTPVPDGGRESSPDAAAAGDTGDAPNRAADTADAANADSPPDSAVPILSTDFIEVRGARPHAPPPPRRTTVSAETEEHAPLSDTPSMDALVRQARPKGEKREANIILDPPVYDRRPPDIRVEESDTREGDRATPIGRQDTNTDIPVAQTKRPPDPQKKSRTGPAVLLLLAVGAVYVVGTRALREPERAANPAPAARLDTAAPVSEAPMESSHATSSSDDPAATVQAAASAPAEAPQSAALEPSPPRRDAPAQRGKLDGNARNAPPSGARKEPQGTTVATSAASDTRASGAVTTVEPPPVDTAFNANAADLALSAAAQRASTCRKGTDPSGTTTVTITFSPTGRVTTANISGPPFAGTETGSCIASTMRTARVPPFAGDFITVKKTVAIQ